jgi:hypothetical protein
MIVNASKDLVLKHEVMMVITTAGNRHFCLLRCSKTNLSGQELSRFWMAGA